MNTKTSTGYLVARASHSLAAQLYKNFMQEGIDLPHAQYVILRNLYTNDGLTQQELANALSKDKAAIKRTIDNLVSRKYVTRVKNGSAYRIFLTDSAIQMRATIDRISDFTIQQSLENISTGEYEIFHDVLNRIIKNTEHCTHEKI